MKEASELEKLNAAARAEANKGSLFAQLGYGFVFVLLYSGLRLWLHIHFWRESGMHAIWLGLVMLLFICFAIAMSRLQPEIKLGRSPACESERQRVSRWITQSKSIRPGVIQFSANSDQYRSLSTVLFSDRWKLRVLVRLFVEDGWIVVARFEEEDIDTEPTLAILDARSSMIAYSPERKLLQLGNLKFRMVDFTPELTALAQRLQQGRATV